MRTAKSEIVSVSASPAELPQVFVAGLDAFERSCWFVVFDDVMLDPCPLRLREDFFPVDDATADFRHVFHRVAEVLSAGHGNFWQLFHILDVHQWEASRIAIEVLERIAAPEDDPAQIEFHLDQV